MAEALPSGSSSEDEVYENLTPTTRISARESKSSALPQGAAWAGTESLNGIEQGPTIPPFNLQWAFGRSKAVGFLNLTSKYRSLVVFAASHTTVVYDYKSEEMKFLQGHVNPISSLSSDMNGRWMVTADKGRNNVFIVWDTERWIPIHTTMNPHPTGGTHLVSMSPNAKYIVTLSDEVEQELALWKWASGNAKTYNKLIHVTLPSSFGQINNIVFSLNKPEHIILTSTICVVFVTWIYGTAVRIKQPHLSINIPEEVALHPENFEALNHLSRHSLACVNLALDEETKRKWKDITCAFNTRHNNQITLHVPEWRRNIGRLTESLYVPGTHQALTASTSGNVLLWSDVRYARSHVLHARSTNKKHVVKIVRLDVHPINILRTSDNIVVTANNRGHIHFYDKLLRLLYWCDNLKLGPLSFLSFHLTTRRHGDTSSADVETASEYSMSTESPSAPATQEDSKSVGQIFTRAPSDASIHKNPFPLKEVIADTRRGQLVLIDLVEKSCQNILDRSDAEVTAIAAHTERPHLCVGYTQGHILIYNYESKELIARNRLNVGKGFAAISSLQYAPTGLFVACGLENGFLLILDPWNLSFVDSPSQNNCTSPISQIVFSSNCKYFAVRAKLLLLGHSFVISLDFILLKVKFSQGGMLTMLPPSPVPDMENMQGLNLHMPHQPLKPESSRYVALYECLKPLGSDIMFRGRQCAHHKPIVDIMFASPPHNPNQLRLFSLGEDRVMVEYDLSTSIQGNLLVLSMERIEQTAIPLGMTLHPENNEGNLILVANSEYKYKLFDMNTRMCRKTALGPRLTAPVSTMQNFSLKKSGCRRLYMVFHSEREIGIELLPLDGNPYKSVAMTGHPVKVIQMCVSAENDYLFTIGRNDFCVLMWEINTRSIDIMAHIGGEGLNPYYCLINGGKDGQLFKSMREFFFYQRLCHTNEENDKELAIGHTIPVSKLPDILRAVGMYPTEYEVDTIIHEVSYSKNSAAENQYPLTISFEEFVKIFINHGPAFGTYSKEIKHAFEIAVKNLGEENSRVSMENLISILEVTGECHTKEQLSGYIRTLCPNILTDENHSESNGREEDQGSSESISKRVVSYLTLASDILGILELDDEVNEAAECSSP